MIRRIHFKSIAWPRALYINFQDPAGQPTANPLVVNNKIYMKIGPADYNQTNGYGWYSSPDANWMAAWLSSGPNVLQRSILYSDWGRPATWEFDLPNGEYNVTLSVGWQGGNYGHHKAVIEGVTFVNDEATTPSASYLVRTKKVNISDYKLTLSIGIFDEYTMLNYLDIEAANPAVTNLRVVQASVADGTLTAILHWTPSPVADTVSIRYAGALIQPSNWESAVVLDDSISGGEDTYTAVLPYTDGTIYFALKSQNSQGEWSPLSNNAFWPVLNGYLPTIRR